MKKLTYTPIQQAEKVEVAKQWFLACCDCGLIHRFEFTLEKLRPSDKKLTLMATIYRENARTAAHRRGKGVKVIKIARKPAKKAVK